MLDEALGLGPLEDLLADPTVTEIMVNRHDQIYVERKGKLELTQVRFLNDEQLRGVIERIVAPLGRRIDEKVPMVDARLRDGSRVNAIIPPLALKGPALTIRKFSKKLLGVDDLIEFGSLTEQMATFLGAAVQARLNIVISGGTGSGKTTLLNVLSSFIPDDERIVTIEDAAELQLPQEHVVSLESRPPNIEGEGAITIRDLVRNALRMRPDRIVVGECRGGEALDMLQAMNTGHDGSLTTVHANTPRDALSRLETMALMAGLDLPARAIRDQIASAVNLIVQQSRLQDGTRRDHAHHRGHRAGRAACSRWPTSSCSGRPAWRRRQDLRAVRADRVRAGVRRDARATRHQGAARNLPPSDGLIMVLKYAALLLLLLAVVVCWCARCHGDLSDWWLRRIRHLRQLDDDGIRNDVRGDDDRAGPAVHHHHDRSASSSAPARRCCSARIFAAFVFAAAGYFVPVGRRDLPPAPAPRATIDDQLVDALLLMANALKAGLSLQQALELVVREMKPPISDEFGRLVKEIHLGRLTDDALRRFAERVPLEDVRLAVDSILTLRETGGNLSETFQVIAHTIVERKKVQGKIKAMTAQGMSQGILICLHADRHDAALHVHRSELHAAVLHDAARLADARRGVRPRRGRPVADVQAREGGRMRKQSLRDGERGQTMTEYLMISGIITAVGILVMQQMQVPLREKLQQVTEYVDWASAQSSVH